MEDEELEELIKKAESLLEEYRHKEEEKAEKKWENNILLNL